jgi:arsenate reductase
MAEAFLREYAGDRFEVYSAGLDPAPIHPYVYKVMTEEDISMEGHTSKGIGEFLNKMHFGYLITVCAKAEAKCPIFPGVGERLYWPIEDPVPFEGTEQKKLEKFREARDQIKRHVLEWLEEDQQDSGPTIRPREEERHSA